MKEHHYAAHLAWSGNNTNEYATYDRAHHIAFDGKPELQLTAAFRGDAAKHNPEDLLLAAISSCHMLSYLALCAKYGINVLSYEDHATGVMREDGKGGGKFESVTLHPQVVIENQEQTERAKQLHHRAHEVCFIASSVNFNIEVQV